jgi:hypothetical protein
MTRETMYNENIEQNMKAKALLVFDLISRTLYSSLFSQSQEKDG